MNEHTLTHLCKSAQNEYNYSYMQNKLLHRFEISLQLSV